MNNSSRSLACHGKASGFGEGFRETVTGFEEKVYHEEIRRRLRAGGLRWCCVETEWLGPTKAQNQEK